MSGSDMDAMEEFAAEAIIVGLQDPAQTLQSMAQRFPEASGLSLAFALTCVAVGLEADARVNRRPQRPDPADLYRAVALLTADVFELHATEGHVATGTDLLFLWMRTGGPSR